MSPEISERSFEEAIECALLQHGPDACAEGTVTARETPPPYGDTPPGGCQRSPEPVFLKWKGLEANPDGDFFVRSGPGTVKLPIDSAKEYIRTRFPGFGVSA